MVLTCFLYPIRPRENQAPRVTQAKFHFPREKISSIVFVDELKMMLLLHPLKKSSKDGPSPRIVSFIYQGFDPKYSLDIGTDKLAKLSIDPVENNYIYDISDYSCALLRSQYIKNEFFLKILYLSL